MATKPPTTKKKKKATKAGKAAPKPAVKKPAAKKAVKPAPKPRGRPSNYTTAIAERICARIADGESLVTICKDAKFPARSTVMYWLADPRRADFVDKYVRARELQADLYAAEVVEIADTVREVVRKTVKEDGKVEKVHTDGVDRSRLMMDARKWYASKLAPKKYGDKLAVGGDEDMPAIQVAAPMSDTEAAVQLAKILSAAGLGIEALTKK